MHSCRKYHYGNMELIRDCCVLNAINAEELARQVAITEQHPAAEVALNSWNTLTDAEMALFVDLIGKPEYRSAYS